MTSGLMSPPFARWDGLHLVLDLVAVERHLEALLATGGRIRNLRLRGAGDAIDVEAAVVWKGVPTRVRLELAEIRLRHRHLGFRLRRLRALGAVRVPRAAVAVALRAAFSPLLTVFPAPGIVVVDLRRWLPAELDLRVLTLQATARSLHFWFGAGALADLPGRSPRRLPPHGGSA
ncbi:MAG: hypothetical protein MUE90_02940 [Thermoanaerobaculales bacterium]|jgi:hypothetical protein|nr:hypothetical protein [Thermoanaerobaculales bacterium]